MHSVVITALAIYVFIQLSSTGEQVFSDKIKQYNNKTIVKNCLKIATLGPCPSRHNTILKNYAIPPTTGRPNINQLGNHSSHIHYMYTM